MTFRRRRILTILLERIAEPGDQLEATFLFREIEQWPLGTLEALKAAELLRHDLVIETITCGGCEERCRRPVTLIAASSKDQRRFESTCHLFSDRGPFRYDDLQLRQFTTSRELVANFVRRALKRPIKDRDLRWRRVQFGTLTFGASRRTLVLEFDGAATAKIGSSIWPLVDLINWSGDRISLDLETFAECAAFAEDTVSGSKRVQPSAAIREDNKRMTEIRNRKLQREMEALAPHHPKLSKSGLAKLLAKSEQFSDLTTATIARLTRRPKK